MSVTTTVECDLPGCTVSVVTSELGTPRRGIRVMDWDAHNALPMGERLDRLPSDRQLWFCSWGHVVDYGAMQVGGVG